MLVNGLALANRMYKLLVHLFATVSLTTANVKIPDEFSQGYLNFTTTAIQTLCIDQIHNFFESNLAPALVTDVLRQGAHGDTYEELTQLFEFPSSSRALIPALVREAGAVLKLSRGVYVADEYEILPQFLKTVRNYGVTVKNIDFHDQRSATATINADVAEATEDLVQLPVLPGDIGADARLVTVTAVAFQAFFEAPFNPRLTTKHTFKRTNEESVTVDFITRTGQYRFNQNLEFGVKMVELPLIGEKNISIIFAFTTEIGGTDKLVPYTGQFLEEFLNIDQHPEQTITVSIPKFSLTFEWSQDKYMRQFVPSLFDTNTVDLSGIAGEPGDLFLSYGIQKTYIRLNELGLETPEVPATLFDDTAEEDSSAERATFKADRPFFFMIKQRKIVLFTGRIDDPTVSYSSA